tara:strand:+ start:796 stop:957 length:162 start_codon:yes stop_codon:yes gene_type:complete
LNGFPSFLTVNFMALGVIYFDKPPDVRNVTGKRWHAPNNRGLPQGQVSQKSQP